MPTSTTYFRSLSLGTCLLLALSSSGRGDEKGWITLLGEGKEQGAWKNPDKRWNIGGDAALDPKNPRHLVPRPGKGVLVNDPPGRVKDLISKETYRDLEAHVEFMISKGSNAGVKMMGKYEIQIADTHGVKRELTGSDCGGIYPRGENKPRYHTIDKGGPPRVNAARAPGEWQTLDIVFKAPRFDAKGKKVTNARFIKVVLNGQVIHDNAEVKYPTGAAWVTKEFPQGPLLLQSDHGPVAFRNVRVRPLKD
jgi:3-keto-disaccharide hydrolase